METLESLGKGGGARTRGASPLAGFFGVVVAPRSYANLLYLLLAMPLGICYFVFLTMGLSIGVGLLITLLGIPLLVVVVAGSFGLAALERQLAIHLLGADVPPMLPAAVRQPQGFWQRLEQFVRNPVTWKGMAYLLIKLPLGVVTLVLTTVLIALPAALMAAPFVYRTDYYDLGPWVVDTLGEALITAAVGALLAVVSIHALNGLAQAWKVLAVALLGSPSFAPSQPGPAAGTPGSSAGTPEAPEGRQTRRDLTPVAPIGPSGPIGPADLGGPSAVGIMAAT
ncbi:MAG: sensor domain-containing protein [Acidobacteriota bacterium]|nr:sensor domain-containing protein [Acidobacteriota bacterium]